MASTPKAPGEAHAASGTTAGTHVPAGHEGGGKFPPFDPGTFAPQLVWLALTFGLLYLLLSRVALPRIGEVLDERRDRIQRDLAEAERLKVETDAALKGYEQALSDARGKAQGLAKTTRDTLHAEVEAERHRVEHDLAAKVAETETRIAETKDRALAGVQDIAVDTAGAIVSKLIGKDVPPDEIRRAIGARSGA
jgi:F-type H+-transporting ATPase subunit b